MIRRHVTALRLTLMFVDTFTAIGLFVVVNIVRFGEGWQGYWTASGVDSLLIAVGYGLVWTATLWLFGLYRLRARWAWRSEWVDLLRATLLVAVTAFCALFAFKLPNVSRLFLIELFVAQGLLSVVSRAALRRSFELTRAQGRNVRYMLVIGDGPPARAFARRVERNRQLGIHIVGFLADPPIGDDPLASEVGGRPRTATRPLDPVLAPGRPPGTDAPIPVLGGIDRIMEVLHSTVVDEVGICLRPEALRYIEPIARLCEEEGRIVRIATTVPGFTIHGARAEDFDGLTVLSLIYGPDRTVALATKRLLDLTLGMAALVVLSPILIAVAGAMALLDGRPVIFRQVRVGLHGRPFAIYKFRTMVPDAEERYEALADMSEIRGAAFKMTNDPRITRFGHWLRKSSIDELPQLINVVRGEMSLVGPRPAPPREVAGYSIWHRRRLSMKPGITGLWQVTARSDDDFDRRATLDLDYIDRWSLLLDFRIIVKTPFALVQGR